MHLQSALSPALVLLDVHLPGLDGFEVLRRIGTSGTPVIMLTAREEEVDKLVALRMGADDYVVKPYSPTEVVARVAAVLRRATPSAGEPGRASLLPDGGGHAEVLQADGVEVDVAATTVRVAGRPVQLTATEYRLLEHLVRSPRRTFSRPAAARSRAAGVGGDGPGRRRAPWQPAEEARCCRRSRSGEHRAWARLPAPARGMTCAASPHASLWRRPGPPS